MYDLLVAPYFKGLRCSVDSPLLCVQPSNVNLLTRNNFVFSCSHKQSSKNIIKKKCRSWERSCNGVLFLVKFLALEFRATCFCVSYTIEAGSLVLGQREQSLLSTKLVLPNLSHVAKNLNKVVIYFKALSP